MAPKVRLGTICDSKVSTIASQYSGQIEYIDISSVDNVQKKIISSQVFAAKEAPSRAKQFICCGDILVSMVRPNLNAVALVQRKSNHLLVASTGYCVLRCKPNVNNRYLFYFCQSPTFIDTLTAQATGASYPAVNASIIRDCLIPLPPLEMQERAATTLDKVSSLIALRKQQLAKLDELVKARFVEMFGDIEHNTRQYPISRLGEVAFITKLAGFEYTNYITYQDSGDIIMIRGLNCKKTRLVLDDIYWIDKKTSDLLLRSKLYKGDIVLTYVGTVGEVALIDADDRYHLAPNVAKISFYEKDKNIPTFWAYAFMYGREYIMKHAASTTQVALSMGKIRDITFPIPPTELQQIFSDFAKKVDTCRLTVQQGLDKLEVLKKALMQEYFG